MHPAIRHPRGQRCHACGQPFLQNDEPDADFCGRRECLTRRELARPDLVRLRRERDALWLAVTRRRTAPLIAAATERAFGDAPSDVASGLVPFVDRPLVDLPPDHRRAFETHLRQVIKDNFAKEPGPDDVTEPSKGRTSDAPEPAALAAACAACRGDCCLPGAKSHAFISDGVISWFRGRRPDATPEDVAAHYLSHLPAQHVDGSCVYHGQRGCALPREDRSNICNRFLCWFRKELDATYSQRDGQGLVIVAVSQDHARDSAEGSALVRVCSVTEDGQISNHSDLALPALSSADQTALRAADAAINRRPKRGRA